MINKRPLKGHLPPREVFALGSKAKSGVDSEVKPVTSSSGVQQIRKPGQSSCSLAFKREVGPVAVGPPTKKPRPSVHSFTPAGRPGDSEYRGSPTTQVYLYEEIANEVEAHEFLEAVEEAVGKADDERLEALLCGAVKRLKMSRAKPDLAMCFSLMYLAKTRPSLFQSEVVVEAFSSLLKRDVAVNFKAKGNAIVSVLASNILATAFQDEDNWPDSFVKVFLDDSLGERLWVDRQDCRLFVDNIMTAFNTKLPSISMLTTDMAIKNEAIGGGSSPSHTVLFGEDDDSTTYTDKLKTIASMSISEYEISSSLINPRYSSQYMSIETYVLDVIRDQLSRRQPMDGGSRNLVRTMVTVCGYSDIRMLAAHRLEMWLQNPKSTRAAQDLLMSICMNCDQQHFQQDIEVTNLLSKIRLKTKSLVNHFMLCIKELLGQNSENVSSLLSQTIYNEMQFQSSTRNPNNMSLFSVMFHQVPEQSTKLLAEIFVEVLTIRDDHLKMLRALLRELCRIVRPDLNLNGFALGLMCERSDAKFRDLDPFLKERYFTGVIDLLCETMLLSVSSTVREAASAAAAKLESRDTEMLQNFQNQIAFIQRDAVWWLHGVVPKIMSVKPSEYLHGLRKLLFTEKPEHYCKMDNWPPENERSMMLKLVSEVPVLEDTLIRVLLMGLNRDFHLSAPDVIELTDILVRRAALLQGEDFPVLKVDRLEFIDALLNLCTYRHPENIILPKGYQPPTLAITTLYWKAWTILLILCAFNPNSFGLKAWESYPTLKCMMEMTMTNNFKFPPPTVASDEKMAEEIRNRERQMAEFVKHQVLEFEGHLAAATSKQPITEGNSLLITQLTRLEPEGLALHPPPAVIDHIKSLNQMLHIGHMLCRSRNPDFLLDIIQRQGTSQSMPWLAELVESNDSSLDVLPVQCLCEFLLHGSSSDSPDDDDGSDKQKKFQKQQKQEQLLSRLHNMLYSAVSDPQAITEVLGYFLKRLNSAQTAVRKQATKGLARVLSKSSEGLMLSSIKEMPQKKECASFFNESFLDPAFTSHLWLLEKLPSLPQFDVIKIPLCLSLRQACQVETDAMSVSSYIIFLAEHTNDFQLQDLHCLALDLAQLIVERATLISNLLPQEESSNSCAQIVLAAMIHLFYNYLIKAQQNQREGYSWSNTQDQILLQWGSGKCATMNILVVHAMIILLTYGMPAGPSSFVDLLESWFPENGSPPSAFLVDTSEEALLLPDWLKLRMIRSNVHRLVDAALTDLEPSQLLLFVQSFGIPVVSMSKLLHCLDQAVDTDSYEIEQAIVDKGYMAQLIEVQRMRGATGGDKFHKLLLEGSSNLIPQDGSSSWLTVHQDKTQLCVKTFHLSSTLQCNFPCISGALHRIFDATVPFTEFHDQHNLYRSLLKAIQKSSTPDVFLDVCKDIINSHEGKKFIESLSQHTFITAAFLKVLIQKTEICCVELTKLLLNEVLSIDSVLLPILNDFHYAFNFKNDVSLQSSLGRDTMFFGFKEDGSLMDVLHNLELTNDELKADMCFNEILRNGKLFKTITNITCQVICTEGSRDHLIAAVRGFLVDWIEILNSDVVNHLGTELQCVFLKRHASLTGTSTFHQHVACDCRQTYMLGLLINRSSWNNMRIMIDHLLSADTSTKKFCASAVLDFLWACIHLPRLWQGQDKKLSKNHINEDILGLSMQQITVLVDYIIEEESREATTYEETKTETCGARDIYDIAEKRMQLLCRCCCGKYNLLKAVIVHLTKRIEVCRELRGPCHCLLMNLYLWSPQLLKTIRCCTSVFGSGQSADEQISQLDMISHHLINSLASAGSGKSCENRMLNSSVACRKIASDHPIILLRQLPMLSALLQGRAQYTFGEVKSRNLLLLYTHVLGILEVLQPVVFEPVYKVALQNLLQAYLDLIMIHGLSDKSLGGLIQKFLHFLQNYVNCNQSQAVFFLQDFLPVLNELNTYFTEMPVLGSLLAALALPAQRNMESCITTDVSMPSSSSSDSQLTIRLGFPCNPNSIAHLLQRTKIGTSICDLVDVLKELDEISKRCVEILEYFMTDVRRLMLDANEVCRNSSFGFMMRMIRHNPKNAQKFKKTMLESLVSDNPDVVHTALKHIGEYVMLAQEHGVAELKTEFWTVFQLHDQLRDVPGAIEWLAKRGLIANTRSCLKCSRPMSFVRYQEGHDQRRWSCRNCNQTMSIRKGSFFTKSPKSLSDLVKLIYLWVLDIPQYIIVEQLKINKNTVVDWLNFCREECAKFVATQDEIGGFDENGEPIIVEIDESYFFAPKYQRGHRRKGHWVFGGIERKSRRCFMVAVKRRTRETLTAAILRYILPGSHIMSDGWAAYAHIPELEHGIYKHSVVVHEHFFVDPDDEEVHTQKVENMWMRVKKKFKRQCGTSRALFDSYLKEFIFRNAHRDKTRTFTSFLARIRESYPF